MNETAVRVLSFFLLTMMVEISVQSRSFLQRDGEEGVTALMRAARDGERKNVKALLEQGVDIDARDPTGWSALTYAAAKGDLEIVKALLTKGAEIDPKVQVEQTPLIAAVVYKNLSVVKMLIASGANVNQPDHLGDTPLAAALRSRQDRVAETLRKAGAVDSPPRAGRSPINPANQADSRPVLLNTPEPSYTLKARDERIEGVVNARVLVDSDGTVKKVKILTGLPYGLSYQAMDAAYQMIFRPATKNGQPVAYRMSVVIEFRLRR